MITSASRSTDPNTNLPDVQFSFNNTGNDRFCNLTRDRVSHPQNTPENKIAIFIDKDLVEDANVQSEICGGTGIITRGVSAPRRPAPVGPRQPRRPAWPPSPGVVE